MATAPAPLGRRLRTFLTLAALAVLAATASIVAGVSTADAAGCSAMTLRQGARNGCVLQLQSRLATLRYDVGARDGVFGPDTTHAVVAFQKVNGLRRDGVVTPAVWQRLARPSVPRLRHIVGGGYIEVDVTHQVLLLARAGGIVRIVDTSTGRPSTPTPLGAFRIFRKVNAWHNAGLGTVYRPNYFSGGYSIHAYSPVPTYPASHGCVRVTYTAMSRLWPSTFVGMRVWIYR